MSLDLEPFPLCPRFSPIGQRFLVHPDKLPFYVQVPKANPGALPVDVFGQEILGSRTGWVGLEGFLGPFAIQEVRVGLHRPPDHYAGHILCRA